MAKKARKAKKAKSSIVHRVTGRLGRVTDWMKPPRRKAKKKK